MLSIDELCELAMNRRSIRGYQKDKEVPEEVIRKILEIARWAPSGGNGQPWEFIVIRDKETRDKIADLFLKQQEHKKEMEMAVRGDAKMTGAGFRNAPVHIVVLGDPRVNESYPIRTREEKSDSHFYTGLGNATLLIHLAATSLGLGSQYVSDASSPYMATMLKVLLGVPEPLKIYHLIPIGYPAGSVDPRPRRELDEIVHHEKYDRNKFRNDKEMEKFIETLTRRGSYGKKAWVEDDHA
ncbi:MAG: nitroreductase family protein [Deltaproteobacteria bacterium]|jgi:nitroreductase|nr:nitroreductase family protein [Deltaproteobacteria bacterium]